jgi:PII-like signaling protein
VGGENERTQGRNAAAHPFRRGGRFEGYPLYEAIVLKAREMHVAGATVFRGPMGFGHSSRLHTAKMLRLSFDLPVVVEIVDTEGKINQFLDG